jgi:hypothetical protein
MRKCDELPRKFFIATEGNIVITEIGDDSVKGKMVAYFNGENIVNGSFELTLCQ